MDNHYLFIPYIRYNVGVTAKADVGAIYNSGTSTFKTLDEARKYAELVAEQDDVILVELVKEELIDEWRTITDELAG